VWRCLWGPRAGCQLPSHMCIGFIVNFICYHCCCCCCCCCCSYCELCLLLFTLTQFEIVLKINGTLVALAATRLLQLQYKSYPHKHIWGLPERSMVLPPLSPFPLAPSLLLVTVWQLGVPFPQGYSCPKIVGLLCNMSNHFALVTFWQRHRSIPMTLQAMPQINQTPTQTHTHTHRYCCHLGAACCPTSTYVSSRRAALPVYVVT